MCKYTFFTSRRQKLTFDFIVVDWPQHSLPIRESTELSIFSSGDNPEEWEAELEGELNEFEVVNGGKGGEANPEWENQIEEMLEAEEQEQAKKWSMCNCTPKLIMSVIE